MPRASSPLRAPAELGPQYGNYNDPKYLEIYLKNFNERDAGKRVDILYEANHYLGEHAVFLPFYYYVSCNLFSKENEGFYPNINDLHSMRFIRPASGK